MHIVWHVQKPVNEDNQRQHCALRQDEAINLVIFAHAIALSRCILPVTIGASPM